MPTHSKAAVLVEPNAPLVIDDVTFPDPQPDQVLIKLFASGICHSQLHQIHRTPQTAHRGTPAVYPSLLGHEATGVVVARGHQVTHVQEGDHVMTTWVDRGAVEGAPRPGARAVAWPGCAGRPRHVDRIHPALGTPGGAFGPGGGDGCHVDYRLCGAHRRRGDSQYPGRAGERI